MKKKISATNPRQAEVGDRRAGSILISSQTIAATFAALSFVLCMVLNLWPNREPACAISNSSTQISGGRFSRGANGILQNVGLAVFVSGLIPCLPQDSPKQPPQPNQCSIQRGSGRYPRAGEQHPPLLYLEILAGIFLCALISWGDHIAGNARNKLKADG